MPTYWAFFSYPQGLTTSSAASNRLRLNSASALSFGGGAMVAGDFQANVNINTWNTNMHYAKSTAESSTDYCLLNSNNRHMWCIQPDSTFTANSWSRSTAAYYSTTTANRSTATYFRTRQMAGSGNSGNSTARARSLILYFSNTASGVRCAPVTVWAGTGSAVDKRPTGCYIAMIDFTSSSPTWATVSPSGQGQGPLTLRPHGATALTTHQWAVGIAVMPTQVGFNAQHKMRVQATYY